MGELLKDTKPFPSGLRQVLNSVVWPIIKPLRHVVGQDPLVVEQSDNATIIKLSAEASEALNALVGYPTSGDPTPTTGPTPYETAWREVILCNNGTPETVEILTRTPL